MIFVDGSSDHLDINAQYLMIEWYSWLENSINDLAEMMKHPPHNQFVTHKHTLKHILEQLQMEDQQKIISINF